MIEIKHLTKTFETSDGKLDALNDVSLKIDDGDSRSNFLIAVSQSG